MQFYINSRPVPRAVARYHLEQSLPTMSISAINGILNLLKQGKKEAINFCASYGISFTNI